MFTPEWQGVVEGYAVNFVHRNLWRVAPILTREEALGEARYVFVKVVNEYPDVDTPQWFMSLFKTFLSNRFHDLSKSASIIRTKEVGEDAGIGYELSTVGNNEGYLLCLIDQAPDEIKDILSVLFNAPDEVAELVFTAWNSRRGSHRKTNTVLCQLVGKDPSCYDMVGTITKYFEG